MSHQHQLPTAIEEVVEKDQSAEMATSAKPAVVAVAVSSMVVASRVANPAFPMQLLRDWGSWPSESKMAEHQPPHHRPRERNLGGREVGQQLGQRPQALAEWQRVRKAGPGASPLLDRKIKDQKLYE